MRLTFRRRIAHPFYPALKSEPATAAQQDSPALSGAFEELWAAAAGGVRAVRAVFALRRASDPFLTDSQREALWDLFEVPVYALLVDRNGSVIACECEAQNGLHLRENHADGLLFGRIETSLCDCGRPGPRLMPYEAEEAEPAREEVANVLAG